ncbi:alpha/beta fold hydrolase [Streptomyces montanisoli]|uniref:Alpha/beta hydrolase n=1 Tax=Streptomyces montanisoli TaxID=2798581 RepID=A0A940MPG0_9ACTN|nr:alpha/beta hydrolase [Streptomyces montanisoli]MBP0462093.1 alpha/beta hydrolase [Streptomyces montanisoli]
MRETDVPLPDGGVLHVYDTGDGGADQLAVLWHHGTPNTGSPPRPLFPASERLGIRWISYDRPGYGGSTPRPGRDVASAAGYAALTADALGVDRFAVMGHSGGGPHALACAALLGDRVVAAVAGASLAPYGAPGLDYFAGMAASGALSLSTAARGRAEKERLQESGTPYDPEFAAADLAALHGPWSWFEEVVGAGVASGHAPAIDDDLAYVAPWGFEPAQVRVPVLLLHGGLDRIVPVAHARWLAARLPAAELRVGEEDGHISVLTAGDEALSWIRERAGG